MAISLASPLALGFGGVYNSPEANLYWARRFPGLFGGSSAGGMGGLRALQVYNFYKNTLHFIHVGLV